MNKYVATAIVLASITAGAQTPAKSTTPAKPAAPAKTTPAPSKPAAPATTAAKPAPTRNYKVADDAFISSCSGWASSYSKAPGHRGALTTTGTCTAPSNVKLGLSPRTNSKGTITYALTQSWPLKTKQSTTTASVAVKRIGYTNTAPTTVMVGKSSVTVSNSSPAAPAPKPAPAKPAPAKPAPAPAKH